MTTLLVMTVGQSDVQIVVENQRHKIDGNTCGTVHDAIKQRSWTVVDAPSARSRDIIKTLPGGELKLCTPKLDAVLAHFDGVLPSSALIFETNRKDARDPRLSGEVMKRRLRDQGVSKVMRVAFLSGTEQLEDPSMGIDAVIRRSVVAILSDAIEEQVEPLKKDDKVFVATTGGLAAANELINELVRLHSVSGPTVTALEVPDGDRAQQDDRAVEEKFHPAAGYRARWHALSLVEKGNLLGAWGAVSHLEGAPGQEWTQVIQWLSHFASSLPMPGCSDLPVLKDPRMAVRAALRVELALRAGDIPRAIHGTVAFFEAAFWDWVRQHNFDAESISGDFRSGFSRRGQRLDARFLRDGRINDFRQGIEAWLPVLNKVALSTFWSALTDEIRNLRNDVAHNEPTQELMNNTRAQMRRIQLWSDKDTFLSQLLVQAVLQELGESEPEKLLERLLSEVRRRLIAPLHPDKLDSALLVSEERHCDG